MMTQFSRLLIALNTFFAILQDEKVSAFSAIMFPSARVQFSRPIVGPSRYVPCISHLNLSSNSNDAASIDTKIEGRKNRVINGYKAMTTAYLAAGLLSAKVSGISASLERLGGYIALPAGLSHILISAAVNDRLGSDTYKRLNLAMLQYSVFGALVVIFAKGKNNVLVLSFLLSAINCLKGYTYGVLGWDKRTDDSLLSDIFQGTKDTVKGFVSIPKNIKAFGYLLATTMVASLKVQNMIHIVKFIQINGLSAERLATPLARLNRLVLMTLCLYTLKDAADRNRLGGTTFIELNLLCSFSLGIICLFHSNGAITPIGGSSAVFATFCIFNAITEYVKKGSR